MTVFTPPPNVHENCATTVQFFKTRKHVHKVDLLSPTFFIQNLPKNCEELNNCESIVNPKLLNFYL